MRIKNSDIALAATIGLSVAGLCLAKRINDKREVRFTARVIGYHIGELHTEFEEVSGKVLNHTELLILSPSGYKRRVVCIYHPVDIDVDSMWRQVGDEIEFEMSRETLNKALSGKVRLLSNEMQLGTQL